METQESVDFGRIALAINYITENFKNQPTLDEVAEQVNLSPFHFQKLFTGWAGVSPKKFLQYISLEHAKRMLSQTSATLFDTALETGLSGTGRLHDLFVNIEGMTPGEYKNGGEALTINYSFYETPFGRIIAANTLKGLCHIAFTEGSDDTALIKLKSKFPNAEYHKLPTPLQEDAIDFFKGLPVKEKIRLHLKGTSFQLKVWEALLHIPKGGLCTYNAIAQNIGSPKASRAVGSAIGDNPAAFLIPCHRVIHSTGVLGNYHWGKDRKAAMIGWEAAKVNL